MRYLVSYICYLLLFESILFLVSCFYAFSFIPNEEYIEDYWEIHDNDPKRHIRCDPTDDYCIMTYNTKFNYGHVLGCEKKYIDNTKYNYIKNHIGGNIDQRFINQVLSIYCLCISYSGIKQAIKMITIYFFVIATIATTGSHYHRNVLFMLMNV